MNIKITCDSCKQELTELGGLLFSPPVSNKVIKNHLCVNCYKKVIKQANINNE